MNAVDWLRYGVCPTCDAPSGHRCDDMRTYPGAVFKFRAKASRPHRGRPRVNAGGGYVSLHNDHLSGGTR